MSFLTEYFKKNLFTPLLWTIVFFVINYFIGIYSFLPDGKIIIGPLMEIDNAYQFTFDINNFKNSTLNDIIVSFPKNTNHNQFTSNSPITIKNALKNFGTNEIEYYSISSIENNQNVRIVVKLKNKDEAEKIKIINLKEKNLELINFFDSQNTHKKDIFMLCLNSILYLFFIVIVEFFNNKFFDEKEKELKALCDRYNKEVAEKFTNQTIENDKLKKEVNDVRNELYTLKDKSRALLATQTKMKLILLSKLNDHSKELNFWRDTIRKLLIENKSNCKPDEIIEIVTKSLRTFGTIDTKIINELEIASNYDRMFSNNSKV